MKEKEEKAKEGAKDKEKEDWTHRALVWLLPGVPAHMNDEHVLCLERLLLATALPPLADKRLLVCVDVVVRNVLKIGFI